MDGNQLERLLDRLTAGQVERVRVAFASFEEGLLTSSEFVDLVATTVLVGNARGYALGAALARSLIEQQVRAPAVTPARQSAHHRDEGRVREALGTILVAEQDTLMQLQRLADNEPKQAAADGTGDVIASSEHVDGWTRETEADACDLCKWWAAESHKFPPHARMARHTGCACTQTPITK